MTDCEHGFMEAVLTHAAVAVPDVDEGSSWLRACGIRPESVATVRLGPNSGTRLVNDTRVILVSRDGLEHVLEMYGPEAFEVAIAVVKSGASVG